MAHPLRRFLGVDETCDLNTMLGLPREITSLPQIDAALRQQLARVHKHPDGASAEGEQVKRALRAAAEQIKQQYIKSRRESAAETKSTTPVPAKTSPKGRPAAIAPARQPRPTASKRGGATSSFRLTDFDRAVLAVLVSCGGWNAQCRSRLVALSSAYGVSVQGLMRVITGLSNYARSGGAPLGVAEIAGGEAHMTTPASLVPDSIDQTSDLLARLMPEFKEDSLWSRMKLIVLFSVVAIIATVLLVRVMLSESAARTTYVPPDAVESPVRQTAERTDDSTPPNTARTTANLGPAAFRDAPTFLGSGVPMAVADTADACPELPGHFDEIARKLTVSDEPSEAVLRNWEVSVETIAAGWLLTDQATREDVRATMFDALFAASSRPSVSDELLGELTPLRGGLAEPVDVVRGAYYAGTLGQIAGANLPPVLTDQAREMLRIALPDVVDRKSFTFDDAALAWLLQELPGLVERAGYDNHAPDYWELWLSSVRATTTAPGQSTPGPRFHRALLRAITSILTTGDELKTDTMQTKIVGRLLGLIDLKRDAEIRAGLLELLEDEQVSAQDLWIVTSILVQYRDLPWMSHELVVPATADKFHRRRLAARWQSKWPEAAPLAESPAMDSGRLLVDAELFGRWSTVLDDLSALPSEPTDVDALAHVLALSRLIEAAGALLKQDVATAETILDDLTDALLAGQSAGESPTQQPSGQPQPARTPTIIQPSGTPRFARSKNAQGSGARPTRRGQALGVDGEWAALYEQASRNSSEKLNLLGALRDSAGTDLGPIDAEAFVNEVYRGSPQEVRSLAQSIVVSEFSTGPTVAMEMLDQSIFAVKSRELTDCIARLTNELIAPAGSPTWDRDVRLALVRHALALQSSAASGIDDLAAAVVDSYTSRAQLVSDDVVALDLADAAGAAEKLRETWSRAASRLISTAPTPDDLPGLARRHDVRRSLARGPVQRFVANQVAVLELLAYVTTADRPDSRGAVAAILNVASSQRDAASTVLEQSFHAERAMAELWRIRMGGALDNGKTTEQSP